MKGESMDILNTRLTHHSFASIIFINENKFKVTR
jgi:hypothetical protein